MNTLPVAVLAISRRTCKDDAARRVLAVMHLGVPTLCDIRG